MQAVSHELGSPLSRLRFQLALLEGQDGNTEDPRVQSMTRELDALDELVAELLSYVQSDELEIDPMEFLAGKLLSDLAELAHLEATEESTVKVSVVADNGTMVLADPKLFQRAAENTLRNAVRYARSEVRLELIDEPSQVRLVVHDDGSGIPEQERDRVVNPFVRLEEDRGRKTGGVGLGLAIVSRILDRHGGALEIGDSPLGGAAVALLWPKRM